MMPNTQSIPNYDFDPERSPSASYYSFWLCQMNSERRLYRKNFRQNAWRKALEPQSIGSKLIAAITAVATPSTTAKTSDPLSP